jgi:anti-sigma factor RsiW
MTVNLTCTQVSALLSFYIDDKLSSQLKQFVEAHLKICPTCRARLDALRDMVCNLREIRDNMTAIKLDEEKVAAGSAIDEFKVNLSAYIDNELTDEENLKVKKYIIANQAARDELENMYKLKKAMHNSFDKAKNEAKDDFSKYILKRIDIQEEIYGPDSFGRVVALFAFILTLCTLTAFLIFWI